MGVRNVKIDRNAIWSGAAGINAARGNTTWGAGWLFNSGGIQNDILLFADEFKNLSTSGAYATDAELVRASGWLGSGNISITKELAMPSGGIYVKSADSSTGVYKCFINASGVGFGQWKIVAV